MNYPDEKLSKKNIGDKGEEKAVNFLILNGYDVIARNWRTRCGEIDIIAKKDDIIVFVEVKTLPSGGLETLCHELNLRKQKRIIETAKFFLEKYRQYNNSRTRFDVLVIDMPGFEAVYHIPNAFSE
ncbi:YraN family protein [Treponema pectinovorum]|uniref:YraN family protein n=1 Tax=Treponema pectinovorum TaxID=164 RepID=UPI0011C86D86|nr:YraN family protein [Treponema pectinovorum]